MTPVAWKLWKHRNRVVFNDASPSASVVCSAGTTRGTKLEGSVLHSRVQGLSDSELSACEDVGSRSRGCNVKPFWSHLGVAYL